MRVAPQPCQPGFFSLPTNSTLGTVSSFWYFDTVFCVNETFVLNSLFDTLYKYWCSGIRTFTFLTLSRAHKSKGTAPSKIEMSFVGELETFSCYLLWRNTKTLVLDITHGERSHNCFFLCTVKLSNMSGDTVAMKRYSRKSLISLLALISLHLPVNRKEE